MDENVKTDESPYGRSPAAEALPLARQLNELPAEERAKAATEFVRRRLLRRDDD